MATDDHAIVVGISRYRSFDDLKGPENDTRAVIDWLRDPAGGDVPAGQIRSITSTDFPQEARPASGDVYGAFEELIDLADVADPQPVGRRLYIFMAGHGFGPTLRDASLLMANAAVGRWGHNVNGGAVAEHFVRAAYFEEIVLLMDCCRDDLAVAQFNGLPWQTVAGMGNVAQRWLYAFAACFPRQAREKLIGGEVRGVFTVAVLEALRSGGMTSKTLEDLVAARMGELMGPNEYQRPHFQPGPEEFELAPAIVSTTLTITLGPGVEPAEVTVGRGGPGKPQHSREMHRGDSWELELDSGLYEICREGADKSRVVKLTVENLNVEI